MSLAPGTNIDAYEILAPLGAGGMGEVYRARDPKLGRDVAIKVLPPAFGADAERLRRFEHEARILASLNHPNVVQIFEAGEHLGAPFLVMELLEGETLRERMRGRPLPPKRAAELAREVAQGLAAAHEKGILHRDLKPENIFLTRDGRVKVLDFGLAKSQASGSGSKLETVGFTEALSEPGHVVGTTGYMSPEQVRGEAVDARSDLFSLGVVLWEMVAGGRPFQRDSALETMHAVLKEDLPELDPELHIPLALERILQSCLAKAPEGRFHSAHDLAFALEGLSGSGTGSGSRAGAVSISPRGSGLLVRPWVTAVLGLALLGALGTVGWMALREVPRPPVIRSMIAPSKGVDIVGRGAAIGLALSPDGRRLAFVGSTEATTCLFLRPLDSLQAEPIPGTANARHPFWSPDGRELAFFADRKLKVVTVANGSLRNLCEIGQYSFGGTWGKDGTLYFGREGEGGPIFGIGAGGGTPTPITRLDPTRGDVVHAFPSIFPDGRHLLFGAVNRGGCYGQRILALDTGHVEAILPGCVRAEAFRDFVVFQWKETLLAQRLDLRSCRPLGQAVVLAKGISTMATAESYFSTAADGTLACLLPSQPDSPNLLWLDASGRRQGAIGSSPYYRNLAISPEGSRVAADIQGLGEEYDHSEVRLIDCRSGAEARLTVDSPWVSDAVWSPDGSQLVMTAAAPNQASRWRLVEVEVLGSGQPRTLLESPSSTYARDWIQNGPTLLLEHHGGPETVGDILTLRPGDPGGPRPYRATKANEVAPQVSPDGAQVAFVCDETGREEVYVAGFPEAGTPRLISSTGGRNPRWARDGKALYYLSLNDEFMKVTITREGGRPVFGTAARLFRVRPFPYNGHPFDVHPDGNRFLFSTAHDEGTNIVLIQNWISEVK